MAAEEAAKAENVVRGETNTTLELAKVGHAINLRVYRSGEMKGRMLVGQGAVDWLPKGWPWARRRSIPWDVFVVMMKEWPFGSRAEASLKFEDGELRWRPPGKHGPGRRMSWAELTARLDAPMTEELETGVTKAKRRIRKAQMERREREREREQAQLAKQKEEEQARLAKQKEEEQAQLAKQKEEERARIAKQEEEEQARIAKQKEDEEARRVEPVLIDDLRETLGDMAYISYPVENNDVVRLKRPPGRGLDGKIDVSLNDKPAGWIDADNYYRPAWTDRQRIERMVADLRSFVANPEAAIEHVWKGENRCVICSYKLRVPLSQELGIGPKCRRKYGSIEALKAELARRAEARRRAAAARRVRPPSSVDSPRPTATV